MTPPPVHRLAHVASTMDEAHALAAAGAPHGTAVVAAEQGGGRGQRGRTWASPPGGLWLSLVARPASAGAPGTVAIRAGLALAAALEAAIPALAPLALKWPNDLLLHGRKLAGILVEARWSDGRCLWMVVGVGLNVANPLPPALLDRATRVADVAPEATPGMLERTVVAALAGATAEADRLTPALLAAFGARDALRDRPIRDPVRGLAAGITPEGALLVRDAGGALHRCVAGVVPDAA